MLSESSPTPLHFEIDQQSFIAGDRIDVLFYHPKYIENEKFLSEAQKLTNLEEVASRIKKGIFYILASEYSEDGVPFIRVSNLKDGTIVKDNLVFITEEKNKKERKTEFHPNDILLSKTGNLAVSIIPESFKRCNISQDIIGIEIQKEYNSAYVGLFLSSKFGLLQLERLLQGQVQPHITVTDIKKVQIPIPSKSIQDKVVRIVINGRNERQRDLQKISKLRKELENTFLASLGLKYPEGKEETTFTTEVNDRLDSYFYHPKFQRVLRILKSSKSELKKLGEVATFSDNQIDPSTEPNRLFRYIQIQNIDEIDHKIISFTGVLGKDAPGRARMSIKEGDILVPILGGSMKSVAIVPKDYDGEVATNGFAVLRVSDENTRYFVYYYLTTKFAQMQIERHLTGTIMPSIPKSDLERILVPFPTPAVQKKLASKILETDQAIESLKRHAEEVINKVNQQAEKLMLGTIDHVDNNIRHSN